MKSKSFLEIATGIATSVIAGRPVRLIRRHTGYEVTFSVCAGNCIWKNGTESEMAAYFQEVTK